MISFIIPTYNEEKVIATTLHQLLTFKDVPIEIIVADDQSTDKTVEIVKTFPVKLITGPKKTIAANRNRGAKEAKYPVIVFMDSGVGLPDMSPFFTMLLKELNHEDTSAVTVREMVFPEVASFSDNFFFSLIGIWYYIANNWLHKGFSSGKFQMMKKAVFEKVGGFNENLVTGEDNDLFLRLSNHGKTKYFWSPCTYHGGRRAHAYGWPKLLYIWFVGDLFARLLKKNAIKEWEAIR